MIEAFFRVWICGAGWLFVAVVAVCYALGLMPRKRETMKYRKKPVVIEAVRWFYGMQMEGVTPMPDGEGNFAYINTLEGRMIVNSGDWVITGVEGERYPCKDSIFRATYEPVEKS